MRFKGKNQKRITMERAKYLLIGLLLLFNTTLFSTPREYGKEIYNHFIKGDMVSWERVVKIMEAQLGGGVGSFDRNLELINYYYGLTGYLISQKKNRAALDYTNKGEKIIDRLLEKNPNNSTLLAYKAAYKGFRIGISNFKAVTLGAQSSNLSKRAIESDPLNVQALTERGNVLYYSPSMFGGDKKEGIRYYLRAVEQMERQGIHRDNWQYLSLLTIVAKAYIETGDKLSAKAIYEKILQIEPGYSWVKDELLPSLLRSISVLIRESSLPVCPDIEVFSSALLSRYGNTSLTGA